ncbi:protein trichome birefringence-like 19 [Ipomoea triloba]|uniref:protein trichome birefringence-like 19 n=1 Tax=Ipomoea triloba TaxID=35885 RepID=UPI00125CD538|nr:protein trichome birefringence-like 19 [Ipomoea triloba]
MSDLSSMEFPSVKKPAFLNTPKLIPLLALVLIFLTVFPLYYPFRCTDHAEKDKNSSIYTPIDQPKGISVENIVEVEHYPPKKEAENASANLSHPEDLRKESSLESGVELQAKNTGAERLKKCDIFTGEWVPNPEAPYYTNNTCYSIQEHQNCMKFGRPDNGYLKWKWKPDGCELPVFDPREFLELVRGKSLAFVGDSIARNHMQSLVCLLSRVAYPLDISNTTDDNRKRLVYKDYNFNISMYWAPYLVKTGVTYSELNRNPFNLYLDEFDESWTTKIGAFDFVIINAGHWFFRPTNFYLEGKLVGCLYCSEPNVTHMTKDFSYRWALKTAFRAINSLENFKGVAFLRAFAPQHFEHGAFDQGGECVRTEPFKRNDTILKEFEIDMYDIQRQEFSIAEEEGKKKGSKFRLFDVTQAMLLRPDGHPNKYGHLQNLNVTMFNDCVHWCLPGPIDTWSDFFLELLKRELS